MDVIFSSLWVIHFNSLEFSSVWGILFSWSLFYFCASLRLWLFFFFNNEILKIIVFIYL